MDVHYKIHADSDQVAKFQGDRSRELGERVAKKERKTERKKNITSKTEDFPLLRTGGLIKLFGNGNGNELVKGMGEK